MIRSVDELASDRFYTSIAEHYDAIFPPSMARVETVSALLPATGGRVLDLGCATGHLAKGLAEKGHEVLGVDLDPTLVALARKGTGAGGGRVRFEVQDMTEATEAASPASLDLVSCFGNTLVHLEAPSAITRLCRAACAALRPGGVFIGQIINYDRILDESLDGLYTIDNEAVRFERRYPSRLADGRIAFATTLLVKATGEIIDNEILLYPLVRSELEACLEGGGFASWSIRARIDGDPWSPGSRGTFFEARPSD